jgi:hypothetical protein
MTPFLATWFAAVAGSFVASTVQALGLVSELNGLPRDDIINLVVPSITGGSYFGVALGWLVGATAVLAFSLSEGSRRADALVNRATTS